MLGAVKLLLLCWQLYKKDINCFPSFHVTVPVVIVFSEICEFASYRVHLKSLLCLPQNCDTDAYRLLVQFNENLTFVLVLQVSAYEKWL
jgi:hypothetical protein